MDTTTRGEGGFRVVPFPSARRAILDYLAVARRKHVVHALVDVTFPRRTIREHPARTGESLSFTAYVIASLAAAVDQDRSVQAYRMGRRRLVVFDDVDVCVLVERDAGEGRRIATPHVISEANRKTYLQIHDELRAAQAAGSAREMSGAVAMAPPQRARPRPRARPSPRRNRSSGRRAW